MVFTRTEHVTMITVAVAWTGALSRGPSVLCPPPSPGAADEEALGGGVAGDPVTRVDGAPP